MIARLFGLAILLLAFAPGGAGPPAPGKNTLLIRGKAQAVHYYPATTTSDSPCAVEFLPGDGGWWGLAIEMAQRAAGWGCDVYGVDTKVYLESVTGRTTLTDAELMSDMREIGEWIRRSSHSKVTLVGWSDGAGIAAVAGAIGQKDAFTGVVAIGLPEKTTLAWRWRDDLTYLTKRDPSEPYILTGRYLPRIAPLPLAIIQASTDEYSTPQQIASLFAGAREPKRYFLVNARNHRFDGAREDFYRVLRESLTWIGTFRR
jgi:pimeloyl-ACP methyl ester carboxylesterase